MLKTSMKMLLVGLILGSLPQVGSIAFADSLKNGTITTRNVDKKDYANLAKVSIADAANAAMKSVQGKVISAELKDENGFLVYELKVESSDKKVTEVYVDAGNGTVLGSKAA